MIHDPTLGNTIIWSLRLSAKEGKKGEKSDRTKMVESILREIILLNISNNSFTPTTLSVNAMSLTPKPVEG